MRVPNVAIVTILLAGAGQVDLAGTARADTASDSFCIPIIPIPNVDLSQGASLAPLPSPDVVTSNSVGWRGRGGSSAADNYRSAWQIRNVLIPDDASYLLYEADLFAADPGFGGTLVSLIQEDQLAFSSSLNETFDGTRALAVQAAAGAIVDIELRFSTPFFLGPDDISATLSDFRFAASLPPTALLAQGATTAPPHLSGDLSADGMVDQDDLDLVLLHWGGRGSPSPPGWNGQPPHGRIDQAELDHVLRDWVHARPSSAAVPEPAGVLIGAVMALCAAAIPFGKRLLPDP